MAALPPPLRSSLPAVNITRFFQAVKEAFELHLESERAPEGLKPSFMHVFPQERLSSQDDPFDVITHGVEKSELAPYSNEKSVPRRNPRPVLCELRPHPEIAQYKLATMMWREVVDIKFTIWSKSSYRADEMVDWFRRFLVRYAYIYEFFRARGAERLIFKERRADKVNKDHGQELFERELIYQVRLQYLDSFLQRELESVTMKVALEGERPIDTIERPAED